MKSNGEAPKIVQIETRYVETDATNFRDVVQSLTGKNSSTAWIGRSYSNNYSNNFVVSSASASSSSTMAELGNSCVKGAGAIATITTTAAAATKAQVVVVAEEVAAAATISSYYSKEEGYVVPKSSMLTNNITFKDFDRLLFDLPSGDIEGSSWL